MNRVLEQSEFLKDVCKLVIYATELGYTVTGDSISAPGPQPTQPHAKTPDCAIDLHFFRRDQGAFLPADGLPSLEPLVSFWQSLSPRNAWDVHAKGAHRVPTFARRI